MGIMVKKGGLNGAYVKENIHGGSDLDLAIASPNFGKDRFVEGQKLLQLAWRIDPRTEAIIIYSESYEKDTWVPLIYEIREKNIIPVPKI